MTYPQLLSSTGSSSSNDRKASFYQQITPLPIFYFFFSIKYLFVIVLRAFFLVYSKLITILTSEFATNCNLNFDFLCFRSKAQETWANFPT